jgi:hypothetical protein
MLATYQREYGNFTHLPGESVDALFQRFTVVVNNMRANVVVLPYDDHDRAVKLLHSLDRTIWDGKVEIILESEKYDTLTVNKLFSKLKSAEVDRGLTVCLESPTDSHSLALVCGLGAMSNANASSWMYALSSLMSFLDEEFDMLGEDELVLLTRRFERLHENRVNTRKTSQRRQSRTLHRRLSGEGGEQGRLQAPVENGQQVPIEARSQAQAQAQGRAMIEEEGQLQYTM